MRGYNPGNMLWAHHAGCAAVSKVGGGGTSDSAVSPWLRSVDVAHYPFLNIRISSYEVRTNPDTHGDCALNVQVRQVGDAPVVLKTLWPTNGFPPSCALHLRRVLSRPDGLDIRDQRDGADK